LYDPLVKKRIFFTQNGPKKGAPPLASQYNLKLGTTIGGRSQISAAYRHVSVKILEEFPNVLSEVASQLSLQRDKFRISIESKVDNPLATIQAFNRQFQLSKMEQEAVEWGYWFEPGGIYCLWKFRVTEKHREGSQHAYPSAFPHRCSGFSPAEPCPRGWQAEYTSPLK
jgi:hypothetical protein